MKVSGIMPCASLRKATHIKRIIFVGCFYVMHNSKISIGVIVLM